MTRPLMSENVIGEWFNVIEDEAETNNQREYAVNTLNRNGLARVHGPGKSQVKAADYALGQCWVYHQEMFVK